MIVRTLAIGFALLVMCLSHGVAIAATPDPCAAALPDLPNDMASAFAYELISPNILDFIAKIADVPQNQQRRFFDTVVNAAGTPSQLAIRTALDASCANLDEIYGETRALSLVANHWTLGERNDTKRFDAFAGVVSYQISALSLGDRLSADLRAAAAAPFASLDSMPPPADVPAAPATPAPATSCAETDARMVHYVEPVFPETAIAMVLSGRVDIKLALNDRGQVESARIDSDTLKQRTGYEDLIRETIFAAAASTYAPATIDCKPVPSSFIFSEDFSVVRG